MLRKCSFLQKEAFSQHFSTTFSHHILNMFSTFFSTRFPQQTILNKFSTISQQMFLFFLVIQVALQSGECWKRKRRSLMMSMDGEGGRKNWMKGRTTIEGGRKTEMGAERVRDMKREIWLDRSIFWTESQSTKCEDLPWRVWGVEQMEERVPKNNQRWHNKTTNKNEGIDYLERMRARQ